MDLQLIRIVGKSELPGHPFLYGTTPIFLDHFGLANLQELNELDPTLQRSNPRLKAESYKKKESKTELEAAAEAANAEAVKDEDVAGVGEANADEGGEQASDAPIDDEAELLLNDSDAETEGAEKSEDDDDFFIDDTPDEFDDEDDDEDDEDDEEDGDGEDEA